MHVTSELEIVPAKGSESSSSSSSRYNWLCQCNAIESNFNCMRQAGECRLYKEVNKQQCKLIVKPT